MQHFTLLLATLAVPFNLRAQCPDLVWSDEFDGETLNLNNWSYELGDGCDRGQDLCGWGNQELQYYKKENTVVKDGLLTITAKPGTVDGSNATYTSSRLVTKGKQDFTYGRMEARIKVPGGKGTWPAFWMLSTDEIYGTWPRSGEIDIMEFVGREPNQSLGTIHYGQPSPNNSFNSSAINFSEPLAQDFHDYAVEWEENEIRWFVDGILFATATPAELNGQRWPFDQDFFFILNLAVGGTLGGPVGSGTFPAEMQVDYVRVYGGNRPYITGPRNVTDKTEVGQYTVGNVAADARVTWTVPTDATITSGQGTPTIAVSWGGFGGVVSAKTTLPCGDQILVTEVTVDTLPPRQYSLENFDDEAELTFDFSTGKLTEVDNPAPDTINGASKVGNYIRAAGSQYDVLVYKTISLYDADEFANGTRRFYVDLYTSAPLGTEVLLQLETDGAADTNYPTGRHSRYQAVTTVKNAWERIYLPYLDRPDPTADDNAIAKLILLFAPNSNNGDAFTFDNLDVYSRDSVLSAFSPATIDFPLTVAPNPVIDMLQLGFPDLQMTHARIEVFDLSGRLQLRRDYSGLDAAVRQLSLPVNALPAGVYVARLSAGGRSASVRFVR